MLKNIKKLKKYQTHIVAVSVSILFSLVIGFYIGRYYERETFRKSFETRRNTMMRDNTGGYPVSPRFQNQNTPTQ